MDAKGLDPLLDVLFGLDDELRGGSDMLPLEGSVPDAIPSSFENISIDVYFLA